MRTATLFLIALAGLAAAEDARPQEARPAPQEAAAGKALETPWLVLQVGRMDDALRAHVPDLPPGFGFVVSSVDAGGPAEKAGVKPYDIFWKLDDQWVTNEAQIFALLRLRKVGEEVKLGIYRSGKELSFPVVLGKMPDQKLLAKLPPQDGTASPDVPMKALNPAGQSAEIEMPDGKAVLILVNGVPEVTITSRAGKILFQGPVAGPGGVSLVPDPWKPRVGALERALANTMRGNLTPREPRKRVLPPRKDLTGK